MKPELSLQPQGMTADELSSRLSQRGGGNYLVEQNPVGTAQWPAGEMLDKKTTHAVANGLRRALARRKVKQI